MKPASSDGFLTILGSLLVAALLFVGKHVTENRLPQLSPRVDTNAAPTASSPTTAPDAPRWADASGIDTRERKADEATYKVVGIIDGDTVDILVNQQPLRLRLSGVDTPEKGQPFGNNAKEGLSKLIGGKPITYVVRDTDRYNRSIADLYVDGTHVNLWLVQQGLAWHYVAYSNDPALATAEQQARTAQRGLWSDPRRVAPWNWRKLSKVERDTYR